MMCCVSYQLLIYETSLKFANPHHMQHSYIQLKSYPKWSDLGALLHHKSIWNSNPTW